MKRLLLEIARCEEVKKVFSDEKSPCKEIVKSQGRGKEDSYLPEPWRGHLGTAQILFVSSNPGFSMESDAPTNRWKKGESITDYFENSFSGGKKEWIKDALYPLLKNGEYKKDHVRYWAAVRKIACELLGKDKKNIRPGEDYALTEVVHCKSESEKKGGVEEVQPECVKRYLGRILEISGARVVVCSGDKAREAVEKHLGIPESPDRIHYDKNRKRYFIFMPHLTGFWGPRKFKTVVDPKIDPKKIEEMRKALFTK